MDRVDEFRHFSTNKEELKQELEVMYSAFAERINFLIDRVIEVVIDEVTYTGIEHIKPGNVAGDDGNWFTTVNSDGDFIFMIKESEAWVRHGPKHKGS